MNLTPQARTQNEYFYFSLLNKCQHRHRVTKKQCLLHYGHKQDHNTEKKSNGSKGDLRKMKTDKECHICEGTGEYLNACTDEECHPQCEGHAIVCKYCL